MIEVKGSKTQAQETDPAQRYVLKDADKKSKTPAVLSVLLMGVALYLKSIFPSLAETDEGKPAAEAEKKGEAEPEMALAGTPERPPLDDAPTGTVAGAGGPTGSGGDIIRPLPPVEFMMIESPEIEYTQPEVDMPWHDFKPLAPYETAANDNSGGGGLPDVKFPDDDGTDPGDPTDPVDEDDDDDDTDPGDDTDPTDPGEDDCPTGCDGDGDPCDEDPVDEPCDGDPCDGDPCDGDDDPQSGNRAPRVAGPVYLMDVSGCAILAIGLTDLLRNAVDPDGDMLTVKNLTVSSGALTQEGVGGWVFQGGPQLLGPVTITYQITDGEFTVDQTAHFSVVRSFIGGTDGDDMLLGTMCADDIDGGDGDDNIDGRAGNDVISGGCGDDHIVAGSGNDTVFGGVGDDIVFGGAGNDHISGGEGDDRLYGEEGDDLVFGDGGDDHLSGGSGDDLLSGGEGDDVIEGGAGDDVVDGGAGDDKLNGGPGDDVIDGGAGNDVVEGGTGEDTVHAGAGNDVVKGDAGDDHLSGGRGDDRLSGGVGNDIVQGGAGDDCLSGGSGNDLLAGGDGCDVIQGGAGDDKVIGGSGDDELNGGAGDDHVDGGIGNDIVDGGTGNDLLLDGAGEDTVHAGAGNDRVVAAPDGDNDTYDGGEGCDTLDYSGISEGVTVNLLDGTACGLEVGEDTISGFETVVGGQGDDLFIVGDEPAILVGGDGGNTFEFLMADPASEASPAIHQILDFKVGDMIRMSRYDIFEEAPDVIEDLFEAVYGDDIDADDIPIRFRHDTADEMMRTVIETDFDNDDVYETTISLHGHHVLVITEQA